MSFAAGIFYNYLNNYLNNRLRVSPIIQTIFLPNFRIIQNTVIIAITVSATPMLMLTEMVGANQGSGTPQFNKVDQNESVEASITLSL
jgi:hypothetical protein